MDTLYLLRRPIGPFEDVFEAYAVALPFIEDRIPPIVFRVSLYLPLVNFLLRKVFDFSVSRAIGQPKKTDDSFESEYADLLAD